MPSGIENPSSARRRRAVRACRFCRSRKIKCNNEAPVCANCKTYGKDCVYEPTDQDASPVTTATARGSTFPAGRSILVSTAGPGRSPVEAEAVASTRPGTGAPVTPDQPEPAANHSRVSRMVLSANGVSSYHGQTSALFEEPGHDRSTTEAPNRRMSDEWIEKGLMAEAARQRQLEKVNFRAGKLDFDGVDPELGLHLLSLHWNRQHHSFLITYRPAFMRDMACNGPYFSKLLLNAIYFGASKFSPRCEVRRDPDDVRTAGWRFRQRVRELLGTSLDRSDITTIQALLVMTNSLFALGDERSAAWLYAGIAFRMIVDLGMHVDAPDLASIRRFSDEDLEVRRRVFWGPLVLVDKIQSLYQGRPVTLKESDTLVPVKFLDTYEELEHWVPFAYSTQPEAYGGSPAYSVSTFTALCKLSVIMSDILSSIYTERSFDQPAEDLVQTQDQLHAKLITWRDSLPAHLVFGPGSRQTADIPPPQVLSLHAMYYVFLILLHRPFVADGHLVSVSRSTSVNAFMTCATAATEIVHLIRAYHRAFSVRRAPYLISYATYVAATIHVRIAASRRAPQSDAYSSLETCLAVFRENQETNWAVRRATAIVQNLMFRFGVGLPRGHQPLVDPEISHPKESEGIQAIGTREDSRGVRSELGTLSSGHAPPDTEGLDMDGIIQSFVRAQDASMAPEEGCFYAGPAPLDSDPHPAPTADQGTSLQEHSDPLGRLYHSHGVSATFAPGMDGGLQGATDGSSLSAGLVDDLLFGFHGSALDGYPMWQLEEPYTGPVISPRD
ncbi:fungal-specific transcription factor domain-containing protein [Chaetomium sp. MPI-CAGE-AT-0009]|nr:fungal-specific transcription factor domain-containing protein [Chaetomium sp. MPI-CAGE-AT-0009]